MARNWYKLDNAAKLFPSLYKDSDRNGFRIAAILKEDIQEEALSDALVETLKRYPSYCVKLKRGFFWYYFDHNFEKPNIQKELPVLFSNIQLYKNNNFLFSVCINKKRISLDVFHSLGDGTGALEFFKTLCYYYLLNIGKKIDNEEGLIKTNEIEQTISEVDDSFISNYKKGKSYSKEDKALSFTGRRYPYNWIGVVHTLINLESIKKAAHKYNCTITEYLGACILYSAYETYFKNQRFDKKKKMKLFIPVNARKFFDSKTIRNFALFVRTNMDFTSENLTFDDMVNEMKRTFKEELTKEKLEQRLVQNVKIEKSFIVRILPLFIKDIAMKIGYNIMGSGANTLSISNLGAVKLPKSMEDCIERLEFEIGVSKGTPSNFGVITFKDTLCFTLTTLLIERKFISKIYDCFKRDDVSFYVETNDLEVY